MNTFSYPQLLEKTAVESAQAPAAGTEAEAIMLDRFLEFFSDMSPERVKRQVRGVYAANALLYDTLVLHSGIDAIETYFVKTAERAKGVKVVPLDVLRKDNDIYLKWQMDITWSAFQTGTTTSFGMSHLRFNAQGQVILHYDFWDSTAGFFEHLPVVGAIIRWIKRKVA